MNDPVLQVADSALAVILSVASDSWCSGGHESGTMESSSESRNTAPFVTSLTTLGVNGVVIDPSSSVLGARFGVLGMAGTPS